MLKQIKHCVWKTKEFFEYTFGAFCCEITGTKAKSLKVLESLKNKHHGERCFIVCNGPSLRIEDLEKIANNRDFCLACNKIDPIFSKTKWRPDAYAVFDDNVLNTLFKERRLNSIAAKYRFFSNYNYLKTFKGVNNIYLNRDGNRNYLEHPQFSEDLTKKIITIGTVTFTLIEIAVYMGFKEIYIIGCDNSYSIIKTKDGKIISTGKSSYFKESKDKQNNAVSVWEMDVAYQCARDYAEKHGIKIYNATRGGHLEIFKRIDFDTLFN